MIRVVSWQQSGVAWAPWRWKRCLAGSTEVEFVLTASHPGLESYGLPEVDEVLFNVLDAARGADVLHLHHAYAASELVPVVRDACPNVKIVVTLHGEPDRSIGRACEHAPDAYHVVAPDLLALCGDVPATFVPNHPGQDLTRASRFQGKRNSDAKPQLLIPFSHVAQHKDHDVLERVVAQIDESRPALRAGQRLENWKLLEKVAESDAVWVQLRGYFDLLTCECWSLGALPVVLRPEHEHFKYWARAYGFAPICPFGNPDPDVVAGVLLDQNWRDSVAVNRVGMRECWTPARAAELWTRFYQGVVG